MKLHHPPLAFILVFAASAVSAQSPQFTVTVQSNQPVVIGPLYPQQQSSLGLAPTRTVKLGAPMYDNATPAAARPAKSVRAQPSVKMDSQHYRLDCFETTEGACLQIVKALQQYDKK